MLMLIDDILEAAINYNGNDVKRINHLIKVFSFAHHIGVMEKCDVKTQEIEGHPVADEILKGFDLDDAIKDRVLFLIGHHYQYNAIDGMDFQILVEADFLVNIFEDGMDEKSIKSVKEKIFKTKSGTNLLEKLYL